MPIRKTAKLRKNLTILLQQLLQLPAIVVAFMLQEEYNTLNTA